MREFILETHERARDVIGQLALLRDLLPGEIMATVAARADGTGRLAATVAAKFAALSEFMAGWPEVDGSDRLIFTEAARRSGGPLNFGAEASSTHLGVHRTAAYAVIQWEGIQGAAKLKRQTPVKFIQMQMDAKNPRDCVLFDVLPKFSIPQIEAALEAEVVAALEVAGEPIASKREPAGGEATFLASDIQAELDVSDNTLRRFATAAGVSVGKPGERGKRYTANERQTILNHVCEHVGTADTVKLAKIALQQTVTKPSPGR